MPRGQTPKQRRFRKETKITRPKMVSLEDTDKINAARDKITERLEKFIPTAGIAGVGASTAAKNIMNRIKKIKPNARSNKLDRKRASEMSAGGEVDVDMTTEIDV
jgi:pantothenate kinase-related protein Tda10